MPGLIPPPLALRRPMGEYPGAMSQTILIVEDERDLARSLRKRLEHEGYAVSEAHDGATAVTRLARDPAPDLVLLDLMLPDMPGTDICRRIQADARLKDTSVCILSAKADEIDRVVGFELGADDYVVKPFSPRELVLRLKAILRRRPGEAEEACLSFGELTVDEARHKVTFGAQEIPLTALEFRLLMTLMRRKGWVQSRRKLLSDVWGIDGAVTTRTVDTHIKRLREKLGGAAAYIETVRGVGYRMLAEPAGGAR